MPRMFTVAEREAVREALIAAARADARVVAAALTGSAAVGREDRWSDVDLALSVASDLDGAIADWTARMYADHGCAHHLDVWRGATLYRVYLLESTLQVDISFWPRDDFGATAPTFRLLFGEANPVPRGSPSAESLIGLAWLYALHARSSAARGRRQQARYMLEHVRDHVLALACMRHGLPVVEARGVDDLPPDVIAPYEDADLATLMELLLAETDRKSVV